MNISYKKIAFSTGRPVRLALLAGLALLLMMLLTGCPSGTVPLTKTSLDQLGNDMVKIEALKPWMLSKDALATEDQKWKLALVDAKDPAEAAHINFLRGYLAEASQAGQPLKLRDYTAASALYKQVVNNKDAAAMASQAHYRLGLLAANGHIEGMGSPAGDNEAAVAKTELQLLQRSTKNFWNPQPPLLLLVRSPELAGVGTGYAMVDTPAHQAICEASTYGSVNTHLNERFIVGDKLPPPMITPAEAPLYITQRLDAVYRTSNDRDASYYKIVGAYVNFFKRYFHSYGAAVALIFLALIIKLVTAPMTSTSFRGMREMQRVQPFIKELQEKYKDDKQKLATAQMELMKEHKVNPMKGCLPMLIQLPIFWVVYRAVQVYAFGFANAHFLWIKNLEQPDTVILVLYALSMIITQKLTTAPPTDPQQKAMQTQMTYIMPLMLFLMLSTLASAFVLYWFFLNVFSSIQQYYLIRQYKIEDEAQAAAMSASLPKLPKKGK